MTTYRQLRIVALAAMVLAAAVLGGCRKNKVTMRATYETYPQPVVAVPVAPAPVQPQYQPQPVLAAQPLLSAQQLDALLAPIALYPDSLLAEILPACTYPAEVAGVWQWLRANPAAGDAAIDSLNVEPPVKAVAHYPTVHQMLVEHADWAQAIGAAFMAQQDDVLMSIQRLRAMAIEAQTLQTTPQQEVIVVDNYVEILPASPDVIYVPVYDPVIVYVRRPQPATIFFSVRFSSGRWMGNCFDWHSRRVYVGAGWHPRWRYEGNHWRPVDRGAAYSHGPTITRVTRPAAAAGPIGEPWSHNPAKPRPALPAAQTVSRPDPTGQRTRPTVDVRPARAALNQTAQTGVAAPRVAAPKPVAAPQAVTPKPVGQATPPAARPTPERGAIRKPTTPPQVGTAKPIATPTTPTAKPMPERRPTPTPTPRAIPKPNTPQVAAPKPVTPPQVVTPKPVGPPTPPAAVPTPPTARPTPPPTPAPVPRPIPRPNTPPNRVEEPRRLPPPTPPTARPIAPPTQTPPSARPMPPTRTEPPAGPVRKPEKDSDSGKR